MKLHIRTCSIAALAVGFCCLSPVKMSAIEYPKDMPTIEALIDLHKRVKKDEDKAKERIATSYGEQNFITKTSEKFNKVRSTLDSKMNDIHSYVILAGAISGTANSLYRLVDEYKDFTVNTYKYVTKKPFVAWYYVNANVAIEKEIKHCVKLYGIFAASGTNLWRAAMDEKLNLLFTLKTTIDNARSIIYTANFYCSAMMGGWKPDYIWEILTSDVRDEIVGAVIANWKKKNQ